MATLHSENPLFFLDTNIFVYALWTSEPRKKLRAVQLLEQALASHTGCVQGLYAARGALGFCSLGLAADKRYSLVHNFMSHCDYLTVFSVDSISRCWRRLNIDPAC